MKLHVKQFLLILLVIIMPMIVTLGYTYTAIRGSIEKMEIDNGEKALQNAQQYAAFLMEQQKDILHSWAYWDDLYDHVESGDALWIKDNVLISAVDNTSAEITVVLDHDFKVLGEVNGLDEWNQNGFENLGVIQKLQQGEHFPVQIYATDQGIYLVAGIQIVGREDKNFDWGNGYLLFGREVTSQMLEVGKMMMDMDLQIELTGGPIIGTSGYMNSSIGKRININDKSIHTTTLFKKDHVLVESKKVFRDEQQVPIGILKVKIIDHGGIAALRILRISFLGLLVIIIVLSGFMQVWLTRNIISPIGEMGSAAAKLQNKNFSSLINVSTKDEIGDLAASFNGMVQEMNSVIRNMKNRARVVAHHGGSLATISCHMTEASQQVSTAIAETAAGINAQANELIEITNALHHFGHKIHRIVQTVDEIELKSQQLFTSAAQSNKQLQVVEQAFDDVEQLFEQIRIKTEKLYDSVKQVMNISHMIQDISDQTNLLALNAMIEAANSRKGSSGFTVIALEIRKLAEQCKGFSKEIQQIVKLFSDDHKEILDEVQLANVTLTEQADIVRYTLDAIKEITIGVEDIIPCIHEIYSTSQEVRSEQKSVFGRVEEVSAVTQEICASAQEISASAQEMYGAAEEVAASAQVLEQEAKGIKSELDAFILEA